MSSKKPDPLLKSSLNLGGSADAIKTFYTGWAKDYDDKVHDWKYTAPDNALYLMQSISCIPELMIDINNSDLEIMDAGCGTGLVGQCLKQKGYTQIDGFDLSQSMVDVAQSRGNYRYLEGNIDINKPMKVIWNKKYDCTISIGVFTLGHVAPEALSQLQAITRIGGLIIVSTRVAYYESENYQACSERLEKTGNLKLIHSLKNAPYTEDSEAHYWAYVALK